MIIITIIIKTIITTTTTHVTAEAVPLSSISEFSRPTAAWLFERGGGGEIARGWVEGGGGGGRSRMMEKASR